MRGDGRPTTFDLSPPALGRSDPRVSVVISSSEEGQHALSAAELASIESERTRDKLKSKADHVSL